MHLFMVVLGGLLMLSVFLIFAFLWREAGLTLASAAWVFLPAWAIMAAINMWVGVAKAGYSVRAELPILLLVFAVPAIAAVFVIWRFAR